MVSPQTSHNMADGRGWEGAIHVCDLSILLADRVKRVTRMMMTRDRNFGSNQALEGTINHHCNIEIKVAGSKQICQVVTGYASRHLHLVHIAIGIFVAITQYKQEHE